MTKVIKFKDNNYLYGAIIEQGSNSNGNYIKFSNGTLIQWGMNVVTTGSNYQNIGGIQIYYGELIQTFPIPFINTSTMTVSAQVEGGGGVLRWIDTISSTNNIQLSLQSTSSNYQRTIKWLAIGKWK